MFTTSGSSADVEVFDVLADPRCPGHFGGGVPVESWVSIWLEAHLGCLLPISGVRDSTPPVHAQLVPLDLHGGLSGAPRPPNNMSSSEPCTHASAACRKFRSLTVLKARICNHQQNSTSEELKLTPRFCWFGCPAVSPSSRV